jgi:phosphoadenosine phosphosulfate reductase
VHDLIEPDSSTAVPARSSVARSLADLSATLATTLARIAARHRPTAFASSFGVEDMVLLDTIARHALPIDVFVLDTGRLPPETYDLIEHSASRYGILLRVLYPDALAVEDYATRNGVNAFYRGIDLRERCCAIRKTEPLSRALAGKAAWITGLRRSQSVTRRLLAAEEFDTVHGMPKFNPLLEWSTDEVWAYVRANGVPYNGLHDRGYPSIGCAPCTRAIEPGEDLRAGRWWWEQAEHRECGLHRRPVHVAVRIEAAVTRDAGARTRSPATAEDMA